MVTTSEPSKVLVCRADENRNHTISRSGRGKNSAFATAVIEDGLLVTPELHNWLMTVRHVSLTKGLQKPFGGQVYEVDSLCCPECGGQMQVVSFIEPPQPDVIEAILKYRG